MNTVMYATLLLCFGSYPSNVECTAVPMSSLGACASAALDAAADLELKRQLKFVRCVDGLNGMVTGGPRPD